jgi:hypothetical protein
VHTKDEWLPPLHLELELSLEHEKELVFVLVAVPVDELPSITASRTTESFTLVSV